MLSTSCKYAIRAAVYLMSKSGNPAKSGIREIAEEISANEHTTGKILQLLARAGQIASTKGPHGGFYIPPDSDPIYLIDIVSVIDGTGFFFECGLGLTRCSETKPCPIHYSYKASRERLFEEFSTITIQELAQNLTKGKAYLNW